jgi:hypothetical protein
VLGPDDPADARAAVRAGLAVPPVHGEPGAEGGDVARPGESPGPGAVQAELSEEFPGPAIERLAGRPVEPGRLFGGQSRGERDGAHAGGVEGLVAVGVPDAAEPAGVGEGTLERSVFGAEGGVKLGRRAGERVQAARVQGVEGRSAIDGVEGGPLELGGLGQHERAGPELERRLVDPGRPGPGPTPQQPPRDHQVDHQEPRPRELHDNPFAKVTHAHHRAPLERVDRGLVRAEQGRAPHAGPEHDLADDPPAEPLLVHEDVREFGHGRGHPTVGP